MIGRVWSWFKRNWQILLIGALLFLLFKNRSFYPSSSYLSPLGGVKGPLEKTFISQRPSNYLLPIEGEFAPEPQVRERLVVKNSWLSLLVNNVEKAQEDIKKEAERLGGYMVGMQVDSPEGVSSGSITVRVPTDRLDEYLSYVRGLGVRVVSENLVGRDVTDEYVDIQARLDTVNKAKRKLEEILEKAEKTQDILQVQRELMNIQQQIDNLKGREKYLKNNAQLSKVTVYLSTDELALPYSPAHPWRPQVIFKQAVRSLLGTIRAGGTAIIWLVVYSVIWLPLLLLVWFIKRKIGQKE